MRSNNFLHCLSLKGFIKIPISLKTFVKNHYLKIFSNQLVAPMDVYLHFTHRISVFEHFEFIFEILLIHAFAAFCVCLGATVHTHLKKLDPFLSLLMSNHLQKTKFRLSYLVKKIIPVNCFLNGKKIVKEIKKPQPTIFIHTWKPVSSKYLKEECIIFAKKSLLQNPWGKKEMQFRNPIIHKLRIIFNWIALVWVPFILITPSKSLIKKIVQSRHVLCTGSIKVVFPLAWTRIKLQKRLNFLHSIVNPPHFCNLPRLKITSATPRPTSLSIYSLAQ